MTPFSWKCPFCGQATTITDSNFSSEEHRFCEGNKYGDLCIVTKVVVCPNDSCKEYAAVAILYKLGINQNGGRYLLINQPLLKWQLRPRSNAVSFPSYIPSSILSDYEEACLIKDLSPKASATLSRRCLQGIIRDYWKIEKDSLYHEIIALQGQVDQVTWEAIDAVRSLGNIGAHMEKDINLIIDVEPEEAELLTGLIEILLRDWYIARHDRQEHLKSIISAAEAKKQSKTETAV